MSCPRPLGASSTSGALPPASAIATWVALLVARLASANNAHVLAPSLPPRASSTSGAMPPASAIATWLAAFLASLASAAAAFLASALPPSVIAPTPALSDVISVPICVAISSPICGASAMMFRKARHCGALRQRRRGGGSAEAAHCFRCAR